MAPLRQPTGIQEAVTDAPRCNIWWHLLIVGGLILSALLGLGGGFLRNAAKCSELETKCGIIETSLHGMDKNMDEIRADLKELLRRSSNRASAGDKG